MTDTPEATDEPIVVTDTDNSPRPEDGDQDVDQSAGSAYDENGDPEDAGLDATEEAQA